MTIEYDTECIKVYDPTIEELDKKLIGTYLKMNHAEVALGVAAPNIRKALMRKGKVFSPILNKKVAIRLGNRFKL